MAHLGLIDHAGTWPPLSPLSDAEVARITEIIDAELR